MTVRDTDDDLAGFSPEERHRIRLTTSVRDTDSIPKVADAGEVIDSSDGPVQVMHNGVRIVEGCYHGAWMTEVIRRLGGHHEPQEEMAFHAIIERLARDTERPTMVELGSFWAYYALWMRRAIPAARCILVEPDPANLEVGRRNFELNGEECELVGAAVGAEPRRETPFLCESDGRTRAVPVTTVDALVADFAIDRIDVLLCDVQGSELAMLEGARRAIADRRLRFVIVSTHHHRISGDPLVHQRVLEQLKAASAHVVAEHTIGESASGDGLVVASFEPGDASFTVPVSRVRARDSLFGELEHDLAEVVAERDALLRGAAQAKGIEAPPGRDRPEEKAPDVHQSFYEQVETYEKPEARHAVFVDAYRRHREALGRPLRVLDIGCGEHAVLHREIAAPDRYFGVDIKRDISASIEHYASVDLDRQSLEEVWPGQRFDVIFCGEVIEHVFSPDGLLRKLAAVASEEALVVLSTPNLAFLLNRLMLLFGLNPFFVENSAEVVLGRRSRRLGQGNPTQGHLRLFTHRAMLDLLDREGWRVDGVRSLPVWGSLVERLAARMSPHLGPDNVYLLRPPR